METPVTIQTSFQQEYGVTSVDFRHAYIPTNPSLAQEIPEISLLVNKMSVKSPTLCPIYSSHGIYSRGQEGKANSSIQGYKNPTVTDDSVWFIKTKCAQAFHQLNL